MLIGFPSLPFLRERAPFQPFPDACFSVLIEHPAVPPPPTPRGSLVCAVLLVPEDASLPLSGRGRKFPYVETELFPPSPRRSEPPPTASADTQRVPVPFSMPDSCRPLPPSSPHPPPPSVSGSPLISPREMGTWKRPRVGILSLFPKPVIFVGALHRVPCVCFA